jgi:hypothetical protein
MCEVRPLCWGRGDVRGEAIVLRMSVIGEEGGSIY